MSIEITGVTIAHRKKTAAEWDESEYVLAVAEWGYETDTGKAKIGDGVTPWGGLDYFGGEVDLSGYATEEWVENKEYVSNAQIDTDVDLAANSDALIPSQKAVKAYVDSNAGDVDLSDYYTDTETDNLLATKVTKPVGFDESTGDEFKYISGKGTLEDASAIQKIGNMPNVVFSTENVTIGGNPIGYDALVVLDKSTWGFGLVTDLANTLVENSMIVLSVEDAKYQLGSTIYMPAVGGTQAKNTSIADRRTGTATHYNEAYIFASGYNDHTGVGVYARCEWDAVTKSETSRGVYVEGETFVWKYDVNGFADSTMSRLVPAPPATPTSTGKRGQLAADSNYLYYCYAADSWATVPKDAPSDGKAYVRKDGAWVEVDKTLPINWLEVSTSTFLIEPEHAGMSLWVTANCVITVTAHSSLPVGFNCEILKADSGLIVTVLTTGSDTIRDGKAVIVGDASVFKSPSAGVIGLVGDVS